MDITELDENKAALQKDDQASAAEYLQKLERTQLNIAVTGETGSGKSSFVNALRGLDNTHEDAAPTGCVDTTMEVKEYPHPDLPNVKISDLPGIGTTKFPADQYLEHVEFEKYDFFIIVSSERFGENDAKLAKEIQKMEKKFYFVRSKIDDNMRAEARSQTDFDEEKTLKRIRDNSIQELEDLGIESPKVFLVSSAEPSLYDFEALHQIISLYGITVDTGLKKIKAALQNNDQASEKAKEYLEKLENTPLNIAVTGEAGSGKSTFVNALRGLNNRHEDAAPTGCTETTIEVKEYPHPHLPNVTISDLPGIGSTKFPADKYLEHVGFKKYDFFIIVSSERFRENDAKLAKEIRKMEKKFYFVRSKIDHNMTDEAEDQKDFDEEKSLKRIRDNCIQELQKLGMESPQVFLVSSRKLYLYDFEDLCQTLQRDLPEHKQDILLHSLPVTSLTVLMKKIESLKESIKYYVMSSAAGAAVPIPGVSLSADLSLMVRFIKKCQASLGLTQDALCRLCQATGVSLEDLRAVIQSLLTGVEITTGLVITVLCGCIALAGLRALEKGFRFNLVIGIIMAIGLSGLATYLALKHFLKTLGEDAHRVFTRAWGNGRFPLL